MAPGTSLPENSVPERVRIAGMRASGEDIRAAVRAVSAELGIEVDVEVAEVEDGDGGNEDGDDDNELVNPRQANWMWTALEEQVREVLGVGDIGH